MKKPTLFHLLTPALCALALGSAALQAADPAPAAPAAGAPLDPKTIAPMGQKFAEPKAPKTLRVLFVGAGSSHDFPRFFLGTDPATVKAAGGADVAATPNLQEALAMLPQADVLVFSGNHGQWGKPEFQKALNDFADAGKGIVLLHAANWSHPFDNGAYNKRFVGGATKGHGHGDFEVTVEKADHPVMKGVPASFMINDESYMAKIEPDAAAEVLAINEKVKKPFPSVWVMKDPKTRIVCITLGHDDKAHDNPAYRTLLNNAVRWVSQK